MQATITPQSVALIHERTEVRQGGINPLHDPYDSAKLAALIEDMTENGWRGAPLVVDGEQALTGSHRYWAALETWIDIPRVDIEDVCDLFGVDWSGHCDEWEDTHDRYINIADKLPAEIVEYLGLDMH